MVDSGILNKDTGGKLKLFQIVSLLTMLLAIAGCYGSMSGTVVDAETGNPIEGAVVYVEWTKTKGIGLSYTKTYKVAEELTDREGQFKIGAMLGPFVNPPTIVIYKKGYVAWRNDYIFPDLERRSDYHGENAYVFRTYLKIKLVYHNA